MNHLPKISIITPCFNAAKYLEQMIQSIVEQAYENLEFIIIDAGSSDGTVDIIKKYEKHLAYWVSEPDKGQSDAINKGIQVATGDIFNWINADDYLLPGALHLVGEHFKSHPDCEVFCTATTFLKPDGSSYTNRATPFDLPLEKVLNTRGLNQMGMYWKFSRVKDLMGINTKFHFAMDLDLWKRYLLTFGKNAVQSNPVITAVFRLHNESKTGEFVGVNATIFDKENNAALLQYAGLVGENYQKGIRALYHDFDETLAASPPIGNLPVETIKIWLNDLFFSKATRYFYANEFRNAYQLLKIIDVNYLKELERKNFYSFKRWSFLKQWLS
jgi:glycosyltransferase involved in cell wall biosynthesis